MILASHFPPSPPTSGDTPTSRPTPRASAKTQYTSRASPRRPATALPFPAGTTAPSRSGPTPISWRGLPAADPPPSSTSTPSALSRRPTVEVSLRSIALATSWRYALPSNGEVAERIEMWRREREIESHTRLGIISQGCSWICAAVPSVAVVMGWSFIFLVSLPFLKLYVVMKSSFRLFVSIFSHGSFLPLKSAFFFCEYDESRQINPNNNTGYKRNVDAC